MVAFKHTSDALMRPVRRFTHQETPEHPALRIVGLGLLALAIAGLLMLLPDLKRYTRMKTM